MSTTEEKRYIKFNFPHQPDGSGGEWLWAIDLGDGLAEVANTPCTTGAFALRDIVQLVNVDDHPEFLKVVEHRSVGGVLSYEPGEDMEVTVERARAIRRHFEERGIEVECLLPGLFGVSIPLTMEPQAVRETVNSCPFEVCLDLGGEEPKPEEAVETEGALA